MLKDVGPIKAIKPISFLSRAATQGTNYTSVVGWLLYRAFKGRTLALVGALLFSLLNFAGQGGGIFTIYWYARKVETNGMVSVPALGIEFAARTEPGLLWAVVIFSALCFIGGAVILFLSRCLIFTRVEDRYAKGLEQLVYLTRNLPDPRARTASRLFMNYGLAGLSAGCRLGAVTTIVFCNAITAVLGGAAAALFLFRIDTLLTLLILLATAVGAVFLYPLTLRAVRFAKDREKSQAAYREETRRLHQSPSLASGEMKSPSGVASAQIGTMRVNAELILATQLGVTLILAVVVYYMASQMMAGRQNWAILIAYVGALRITLLACSQGIRAYASVSRYYPQIIRYFLFIKDVQNADATALARVERGERLILGTLANGTDISVRVGERLALASIDPAREVQFALLHARVPHSAAPVASVWLDPANFAPGDAAVILANAVHLASGSEDQRRALDDMLADKVTLMVHRNPAKIGTFGEERLLVAEEGEFRRMVTLGSPEGDAALEEFSRKTRERKLKGQFEEQEEEDAEDDLL